MPLRRLVRFLSSPRLAAALLVFLAGWAIAGSFIPQNITSVGEVAAWRAANPGFAPLVDALGLHDAFMSPFFIAPGLFLALCTAVCAWQRTGVARRRSRILHRAGVATEPVGTGSAELQIPIAPGFDEERVLQVTADTLRTLGVPCKQRGEALVSVSPWWSVWGTAVFHWALVALIALMALGSLVRASGQMGVAVGQVRPNNPDSYGQLIAGPWYRWSAVDRSIRVDDFALDYEAGGVRRGPTPTVAIVAADGEVLKSRIVYPNHILRHRALSIYPVDYGLSAAIAMLDASGAEVQRTVQLVDFDGMNPDGTSPTTTIGLYGADGTITHRMIISVPLDSVEEGFLGRLPTVLKAHVIVTDMNESRVLDQVLEPGAQVELPIGGSLKLLGVDYYARLQIVDDPSIPLLYVSGLIAMIGLGIATLARQMLLVARVEPGSDGAYLAMRMHLWRIHSTSRSEIEDELRRALGTVEGSV